MFQIKRDIADPMLEKKNHLKDNIRPRNTI